MIIVEDRLKDLFDTLPEMQIGASKYKPLFDFGSEEDLLLYLNHKSKEGGKRYPLVWLQTPFKAKGSGRLNMDLKLVLATLSNAEMGNRERLETTFKPTLYPLLKHVEKALSISGFTQILDKERNTYTNFFKYGFNGKNAVTDIWDAVKFECKVELTECPQRTIYY